MAGSNRVTATERNANRKRSGGRMADQSQKPDFDDPGAGLIGELAEDCAAGRSRSPGLVGRRAPAVGSVAPSASDA